MSTISQRSVRDRHIVGKAGMLALLGIKRNRIITATNSDPQRRMSKTLTVDTFTSGADYVFTIEGRVLTYTAIAGDTNQAGVAAKLAALINADPQVRGFVQAEAASAVITLTALYPGLEFSASESDSKLTLADVNSALQAASIPFGRVVFYAGESVLSAPDKNRLVKLPAASDLSGDTFILTPSVANATAYNLTLVGPAGARYTAAFTSDGSATAKKIVEGQKSALDALSITGLVVTEDDAALTVALPHGFDLEYEAPRYTSVAQTPGTSILDAFAGIAVFTQDEPALDASGNAYAPNSAMMILEGDGDIFVDNSEGVLRGDACYVELSSGANQGKLYKASSATRALLPMVRFQEDSGDALAIARVA